MKILKAIDKFLSNKWTVLSFAIIFTAYAIAGFLEGHIVYGIILTIFSVIDWATFIFDVTKSKVEVSVKITDKEEK